METKEIIGSGVRVGLNLTSSTWPASPVVTVATKSPSAYHGCPGDHRWQCRHGRGSRRWPRPGWPVHTELAVFIAGQHVADLRRVSWPSVSWLLYSSVRKIVHVIGGVADDFPHAITGQLEHDIILFVVEEPFGASISTTR